MQLLQKVTVIILSPKAIIFPGLLYKFCICSFKNRIAGNRFIDSLQNKKAPQTAVISHLQGFGYIMTL